MIVANIKADLRPVHRAMIALGAKQVPFASSLALNALAKGVAAIESAAIGSTFDTPTPFTQKAYRIEVATKGRPIAIVAAKDIQAQYLAPYVNGGPRFLGSKRGMLGPRNVGLNQYGNLTRGKMQALKAKPNVYIGPIQTKAGRVINGVWQRSGPQRAGRGARRKGVAAPARSLKLLIQFEDTTPAPKELPFEQLALDYLKRNAGREFDIALKRALATARR